MHCDCVRRTSVHKISFSRVVSRGPISQVNRETFSEHSAETAIPEKSWSFLTHDGSGLLSGGLLLLS